MSAKKLIITDTTGAVKGSFGVKYEKLDRDEAPEIEHKVGEIVVKNRTIHDGVVLLEGMVRKGWVDEHGKEYQKDEIKHYYQGQEVTEKSITKVFEIQGYSPLSAYTDQYVISKYYEVFPDDDGHKKDFDKNIARRKNLIGMRALWEYLHDNKVVARGSFNQSSSGYVESDAYLRAISFGNKWALELSVFSQSKEFQHLQENIPEPIVESKSPQRIKRI